MCELNNFLPMLVLPKCIYCKTQQTYVYRQDYQNPFVYSHATILIIYSIVTLSFFKANLSLKISMTYLARS